MNDKEPNAVPSLHFDVHPSVIFQLGADLVTDDMQALLELLKNAYDANAKDVRITVESERTLGSLRQAKKIRSFYPDASGYIVIQDTGDGMSPEIVKQAWMVISHSPKRALKSQYETKQGLDWPKGQGRVPLGDKGLGRLGTQLLGANVELVTWREGASKATHIGYSWADFRAKAALGDVDVRRRKIDIPRKKSSGTILMISGLVDPAAWKARGKEPEKIAGRLASMISPFVEVRNFGIRITIDGKKIGNELFAERFREDAEVLYSYEFIPGKGLLLKGLCKAELLRPKKDMTLLPAFAVAMKGNDRSAFANAVAEEMKRRLKTVSVSIRRGQYFLEWSRLTPIDELDLESVETTTDDDDAEEPRWSLGPFRGEIGSFNFAQRKAHNTARDLKDFWGIYIYRDGFGVPADRDLLKLGREITEGSSYYSMRPANTIGYVALTTAENGNLEEKSDREGFKDSVSARNFSRVLDGITRMTSEELSVLRRSATKILKSYLADDPQTSPLAAPARIDAASSASEILEELRSPTAAQSAEPKLRKLVGELRIREAEAQERLDRDDKMNELVGLGLSAESLTHEIRHVAENLYQRSRHFLRLKLDAKSVDFGVFVKTAAAALRRQIDVFDPSLRRSRDRRDTISMVEFLNDIRDFYGGRADSGDVEFKIVDQGSGEDMKVLVSRGLLMQVIDNLVRNSIHWVGQTKRRPKIITFEVQSPYVWVSDSGPGFSKSIEGLLFEEPFVSRKDSPDRRGLGLYISRIFMRKMGGDLSFYEERNEAGRYYALQLDFSGAVKQ